MLTIHDSDVRCTRRQMLSVGSLALGGLSLSTLFAARAAGGPNAASGLLTGKYNDGVPAGSRAALKGYEWLAERIVDPAKIAKVRQLVPIARDLDCTLAQLALAWCIKNPRVSTVITGATRPEQVIENMKAQDVAPRLTAEVLSRIDAVVGAGG